MYRKKESVLWRDCDVPFPFEFTRIIQKFINIMSNLVLINEIHTSAATDEKPPKNRMEVLTTPLT